MSIFLYNETVMYSNYKQKRNKNLGNDLSPLVGINFM